MKTGVRTAATAMTRPDVTRAQVRSAWLQTPIPAQKPTAQSHSDRQITAMPKSRSRKSETQAGRFEEGK